jgi:hypothetical protein
MISESVPGGVSAEALRADSRSESLGYFHIPPFSKPRGSLFSAEVTESEPVVRRSKVATPAGIGGRFEFVSDTETTSVELC